MLPNQQRFKTRKVTGIKSRHPGRRGSILDCTSSFFEDGVQRFLATAASPDPNSKAHSRHPKLLDPRAVPIIAWNPPDIVPHRRRMHRTKATNESLGFEQHPAVTRAVTMPAVSRVSKPGQILCFCSSYRRLGEILYEFNFMRSSASGSDAEYVQSAFRKPG
jgi:hypothetical protein